MNRKYSLKQIRAVWINAYLKGEVDWLGYLEAPCFFIKDSDELIFKANQIANIERRRAKFPNKRATDFEFKETVERFHEYSSWAVVSGSACFKRGGDIVSQCNFFELWLLMDDRWQIASLCLEYTTRSREMQ
ncbi:hypothetical protein D9M68_792640 [compost metagenome]